MRANIDLTEAAEMWQAGAEVQEIAARYGLSRNGFYGICERNRHLFPLRKSAPLSVEELDKASVMYKERVSIEAIATHLSRSVYVIKRAKTDNPGLFPRRYRTGSGFRFAECDRDAIVKAMELPADRMKWKLENGACITLPRVSSISCPR